MAQLGERKPCPLCGTLLPYDKWLKVVNVFEEQQKFRKQLELELKKQKEESLKLKKEHQKYRKKEKEMKVQFNRQIRVEKEKIKETNKNMKEKERAIKKRFQDTFEIEQENLRMKFEKDKKLAVEKIRVDTKTNLEKKYQQEQVKLQKKLEKEKQRELKRIHQKGIETGIEKQKAKVEKVSIMADKARKERDKAMERVKELEEMIKKGTTPQIGGFDFEREVAKQLRTKFPEDEIKPTGRKGDIIQTVRAEGRNVGKIMYECKKTQEFQNKFIEQIRRDKNRATADYGVILTWATKEDRQSFWVEGDIIIVHPYGVLDVATFLRETLVQMYTLKMSKSEFEAKGKALLEFIQSEEFRSKIQDSIVKSKEAYELLKKEVNTHVNTWKKRFKIYASIHKNTGLIQQTVRYVLLRGKTPVKLPETEEFPSLPKLTD